MRRRHAATLSVWSPRSRHGLGLRVAKARFGAVTKKSTCEIHRPGRRPLRQEGL